MTLSDRLPEMKTRYLTDDVRARLINAIEPKVGEHEISSVFDGLEKALHKLCIDLRNDIRRGSPAQERKRSKDALVTLMLAKSALQQLGPDAKYNIYRHFDECLHPFNTVLCGIEEIIAALQDFVDSYEVPRGAPENTSLNEALIDLASAYRIITKSKPGRPNRRVDGTYEGVFFRFCKIALSTVDPRLHRRLEHAIRELTTSSRKRDRVKQS
jgi:hypothetical protein